MHLFTRTARLAGGKFREAMAWAIAITENVTETSGFHVNLQTRVFSPETGTLAWSTIVPDLATLEAGFDKLMVDDNYNDLTAKGSEYILPGSLHDGLGTIVYPNSPPAGDRRVGYISIVQSTISPGHLAEGVLVGVEIAQEVERITGLATLFVSESTGNYGGVMWGTAAADIAELEAAEQALASDLGFVGLIDSKAAAAYTGVPGATTQVIYRRLI
jgi:hypothetical protein